METPKQIKIVKPSKDGDRWYDDYVGNVFKVVGYIPKDDCYEIDVMELYDKAKVNQTPIAIPREAVEPV